MHIRVQEITGAGISLIYKSPGAHTHTHNLGKIRDQNVMIYSDWNTDMQCNILQVLHMQTPPNTNQKAKMLTNSNILITTAQCIKAPVTLKHKNAFVNVPMKTRESNFF